MDRRSITENEKTILQRLLSVQFNGCKELLAQVENCEAAPTGDDDNYGSIYLFPEKTLAPANVERRVPVEGLVEDSDGEEVNILVHVVEGYLNELEFVKLDGSQLKGGIVAEAIKIVLNKD